LPAQHRSLKHTWCHRTASRSSQVLTFNLDMLTTATHMSADAGVATTQNDVGAEAPPVVCISVWARDMDTGSKGSLPTTCMDVRDHKVHWIAPPPPKRQGAKKQAGEAIAGKLLLGNWPVVCSDKQVVCRTPGKVTTIYRPVSSHYS
jgi:hypothetical protein